MWNKSDYLTTRKGSGNQVLWNKLGYGTKYCRVVLYVVINIFVSVEDCRFYLKHLLLYNNLLLGNKNYYICGCIALCSKYSRQCWVEWLGDCFTAHSKVLWAKRSFPSHSTVPGYLSVSAYSNHENPEDSRCSTMNWNPARPTYRFRSLQLRQPVLWALRIVVSFVTMGSFIWNKWISRLVRHSRD